MAQPYDFDFPELVRPPATTWRETLEQEHGYSHEQSMMVAINVHHGVLRNVGQLRQTLGAEACAFLTDQELASHLPPGYEQTFAKEAEYASAVSRIGQVLRGEMDLPDFSDL